ncbi:MAG: FxSxx-COOH system tetratricopeptide repeat protein [Chloroflexi bacterium]|nr:FxSxx-COOH system tetratricopeptide repeat protein [Chloroflexota bacterium]MCI0580399.1 FxSxx-COOH system tetratricopeptide repeat protein [Chloroflexota bacterium]MCI0650170.1 FxSxx-COOH system tetratricopeptide repeat protein [Chloroflexota bacterium]MCI0729519.1 FxSxx-COOH system tetratricopeptide repeat protein [Chloroflexota bacterium]
MATLDDEGSSPSTRPSLAAGNAAGEDPSPASQSAGDKAGRDLFKDVTITGVQGSAVSLTGDAVTGNIYKVAGDLIIQPALPAASRPALAEAQALLASLPTSRPLKPDDLPPGSRLPLARNPLFTGREAGLQHLATVIKAGGTVATHQAAAIAGLGGVGKSQLASEFVYRYGRHFAGGVFWLSFADPASVPAEVAACGQAMGLWPEFGRLDLAEQVARVLAAWREPLPRLLVFDSCAGEAMLAKWRPTSGGCRVLVTSRRGRWDPSLGVVTLALDVLSRVESVALLQRLAPGLSKARAGTIAAELGDFPLALSLAGSFLARYEQVVSPLDYLVQLQSKALLDHPSLQGKGSGRSPTGHEQHVGRTFAISFSQLEPAEETDRVALALLARAACFAPGVPIPRFLLAAALNSDTPAGPAAGDVSLVEDGLARLAELGLLEEAAGAVQLHRLLAFYVQDRLAGDLDEAVTAVASAVSQAASAVNEAGYPKPLLAWQEHLRHVACLAGQHGDERAGGLWNELGYHLDMVGDYAGARRAYEQALAIDETALGSDHLDVARDANNLGTVLAAQGEYAGAWLAYERALAIFEQKLGPDHPRVATLYNNLGLLLRTQGDYAAARTAYERALAIDQAIFGPDHPKVAVRINNLGSVLRVQGDYAGARAAFERALAIHEAAFGPEHPNVAIDVNNLAGALGAQGDYAGAQTAYERALAIDQAIFGPRHPNVAIRINNLGAVLKAQGDYVGARLAYEEALAIDESIFGPCHPSVARDVNNLGGVLKAQGDYAGARAAHERALAIDQVIFGPQHPDVAIDVSNLGGALAAQGDTAGARAAYERALATFEQKLGPDHPHSQKVRRNLAALPQKKLSLWQRLFKKG